MKAPQALEGWLSRHRNATNFWLHMLGIPACFVGMPVMLALQHWLLAGVLFVAGYALQFTKHIMENNRSGEEMLIRKIIERRRARKAAAASAPDASTGGDVNANGRA